jgi:outer membrane protein TolC
VKNLLLGALLLANSLSALTLSELIESSLSHAPSLEIINARLAANKQNIDIADQFENPELLLTKNTLENSQAMSQTVLTLKQKIPTYSKRQKRQDIALGEQNLLKEKLHAAKVKLVGRIKEEAYTIWELRKEIQIIDEYITLTKQNIRLYESYSSVDTKQHMGIMKAELSLSDLKVQRSALEAKKAAAYARLSYLAAQKVSNLTIDLSIEKKPNLLQLQNSLKERNPELLITQKEIQKQSKAVALAEINNYPDINLIAAYAYREKFDNYFNFGVALSLPIYGTEDAKEQKERAILLAKRSKQSDSELAVLAQLELYYEQMLSSYKIYHIIQDEALPQVAHMFELSNSSISVGSDLFKYIDVLFQKLDLEKKSIKAVANYNRAKAQISQLRGETQ